MRKGDICYATTKKFSKKKFLRVIRNHGIFSLVEESCPDNDWWWIKKKDLQKVNSIGVIVSNEVIDRIEKGMVSIVHQATPAYKKIRETLKAGDCLRVSSPDGRYMFLEVIAIKSYVKRDNPKRDYAGYNIHCTYKITFVPR